MSPRNRELLNVIAIGVLTGLGFASVYIARQEVLSTGSLGYAAFFLGLFLAAHVIARLTVPYADPYLLPIAALLAAVGLTEIYRIDPDDAGRQGIWIIVGVALFAAALVIFRRDYRRVEAYKYLCGLAAIALLFLPALPGLGATVNGARLWVRVGPLQFQPGELAKILLIVFLAAYLREKREVLAQGRLKDFGPLLLIWGGAMLVLVVTRDLGGALLFFGIFLAMLYIATARFAYTAAGLALFVGGAYGVYHLVPHVRDRVSIWLDPWEKAHDEGFQLVQSSYSLAHGGIEGTGLGKGTFVNADGSPLLPHLKTDFIYSALAQELGLIGISAVLIVYLLFVIRGFRISLISQDGFSKLLAAGLTFGFALQTFIIVGGIVRLIPLTGITLPFVSYGGSSVVANFLLLAGLLLVSDRANAPSPQR